MRRLDRDALRDSWLAAAAARRDSARFFDPRPHLALRLGTALVAAGCVLSAMSLVYTVRHDRPEIVINTNRVTQSLLPRTRRKDRRLSEHARAAVTSVPAPKIVATSFVPPAVPACTPGLRKAVHHIGHRLHVKPALLMAVLTVESSCDSHAVSRIGALGYMQVRPGASADAAAHYLTGEPRHLSPRQVINPQQNLWLGASYLALMRKRYAGYPPQARGDLALAAYNVGPSKVDWALQSPYVMPGEPVSAILKNVLPRAWVYVAKVRRAVVTRPWLEASPG